MSVRLSSVLRVYECTPEDRHLAHSGLRSSRAVPRPGCVRAGRARAVVALPARLETAADGAVAPGRVRGGTLGQELGRDGGSVQSRVARSSWGTHS